MIYINNNYTELTGTDNELINDLSCIIKTLEINNKLYLLEQGKKPCTNKDNKRE